LLLQVDGKGDFGMSVSPVISHQAGWASSAVKAPVRVADSQGIFLLALFYAVAVSPFIGGIRGWPCTLGWLVFPVLWLWKTGRRADIGLQAPSDFGRTTLLLLLSVAIGVLCGFGFYELGLRLPLISQFTLALPTLHKSFVGHNTRLFLALIPVGHFVHELFYRGYMQTRLALRLGSASAAIIVSALLYAWTHVFIYSSYEFQQAMTSLTGGRLAEITNVQNTLTLVVGFSFIESVLAGYALKLTKSILPAVAIRSSNLLTLCLLVYSQNGILG
jgi:membrane protease YdiL (CAAX protease family)